MTQGNFQAIVNAIDMKKYKNKISKCIITIFKK